MQEITNSEIFKELKHNLQKHQVNNTYKNYILLDGFLDTSHNALFNIAIGIAANKVLNLNVAFICGSLKSQTSLLLQSIGARPINITDIKLSYSFYEKLKMKQKAIWRKKNLKRDWAKLLDFKQDSVKVGSLIYDNIIRNGENVYTIYQADESEIYKYIEEANYYYYLYQHIFKSYPIKYISLSHKYYNKFGILGKVAIQNKATIISAAWSFLKKIKSFDEYEQSDYKITNAILDKLYKMPSEIIEKYIQNRFSGNIKQHDVIAAYATKNDYEVNDIYSLLNLDAEKPIGLIMPHAFTDAPHCEKFSIYLDYYDWLIKTLRHIENITHIQWLIKPHPSSAMYYEEGEVVKIIQNYHNVKIVPHDIKPTPLFQIADAVITVRGTAGIEAALFDNQVILAGSASYDRLGFTQNCSSEKEYIAALTNINKKTTLPEELKYQAKLALYWANSNYASAYDLIGKEMIPNLPKEKLIEHELSNYEILLKYLKTHSYEENIYFQKLINFFQKESVKSLSIIDFENI